MQVWDRRTLGRNPKPAGLFVGHTDGMTHLDPKGDGRYLISNCKDHTVKLWDLRNMMAPGAYNPRAAKDAGCEFSWYALSQFIHKQPPPPCPLPGCPYTHGIIGVTLWTVTNKHARLSSTFLPCFGAQFAALACSCCLMRRGSFGAEQLHLVQNICRL